MPIPDNLIGKRMIFGMVAIVCATGATVFLKYDGDTFLKLMALIVTAFMTAQTITDGMGK